MNSTQLSEQFGEYSTLDIPLLWDWIIEERRSALFRNFSSRSSNRRWKYEYEYGLMLMEARMIKQPALAYATLQWITLFIQWMWYWYSIFVQYNRNHSDVRSMSYTNKTNRKSMLLIRSKAGASFPLQATAAGQSWRRAGSAPPTEAASPRAVAARQTRSQWSPIRVHKRIPISEVIYSRASAPRRRRRSSNNSGYVASGSKFRGFRKMNKKNWRRVGPTRVGAAGSASARDWRTRSARVAPARRAARPARAGGTAWRRRALSRQAIAPAPARTAARSVQPKVEWKLPYTSMEILAYME